jgi:hypothetical protein
VCGNVGDNINSLAWTNLGGNEVCSCVGDFNLDGVVNGIDMAYLLSGWGACPSGGPCPPDTDGNGFVDGIDVATLLGAWGSCP